MPPVVDGDSRWLTVTGGECIKPSCWGVGGSNVFTSVAHCMCMVLGIRQCLRFGVIGLGCLSFDVVVLKCP